jgi:hypothetical protein
MSVAPGRSEIAKGTFMFDNALSMPWAIPTIFGCLVAITAIVCGAVAGSFKASSINRLKRAMVERGYSAAEIERVIRAKPQEAYECGDDEDYERRRPPKPEKVY